MSYKSDSYESDSYESDSNESDPNDSERNPENPNDQSDSNESDSYESDSYESDPNYNPFERLDELLVEYARRVEYLGIQRPAQTGAGSATRATGSARQARAGAPDRATHPRSAAGGGSNGDDATSSSDQNLNDGEPDREVIDLTGEPDRVVIDLTGEPDRECKTPPSPVGAWSPTSAGSARKTLKNGSVVSRSPSSASPAAAPADSTASRSCGKRSCEDRSDSDTDGNGPRFKRRRVQSTFAAPGHADTAGVARDTRAVASDAETQGMASCAAPFGPAAGSSGGLDSSIGNALESIDDDEAALAAKAVASETQTPANESLVVAHGGSAAVSGAEAKEPDAGAQASETADPARLDTRALRATRGMAGSTSNSGRPGKREALRPPVPGCSPARDGTTIATQLQDKLRELEMQRTELAEELRHIRVEEQQNELEIRKVKHDPKIVKTLRLAKERLTKSNTTYVQEHLKRVNEQLENIRIAIQHKKDRKMPSIPSMYAHSRNKLPADQSPTDHSPGMRQPRDTKTTNVDKKSRGLLRHVSSPQVTRRPVSSPIFQPQHYQKFSTLLKGRLTREEYINALKKIFPSYFKIARDDTYINRIFCQIRHDAFGEDAQPRKRLCGDWDFPPAFTDACRQRASQDQSVE